MKIHPIISEFEATIETLIQDFKKLDSTYFFTEQEIHSHFYTLCHNKAIFRHKGYNLLHQEYPTPFKCGTNKPDIWEEDKGSNYHRAHLDIVLLNPNFVEWAVLNLTEDYHNHICGITDELFKNYITKFYKQYENFYNSRQKPEPILLYALEFKFYRHGMSGIKLPKKEIEYDLNKLDLLCDFPANSKAVATNNFEFCRYSQAIIFNSYSNKKKQSNFKSLVDHHIKGLTCKSKYNFVYHK